MCCRLKAFVVVDEQVGESVVDAKKIAAVVGKLAQITKWVFHIFAREVGHKVCVKLARRQSRVDEGVVCWVRVATVDGAIEKFVQNKLRRPTWFARKLNAWHVVGQLVSFPCFATRYLHLPSWTNFDHFFTSTW